MSHNNIKNVKYHIPTIVYFFLLSYAFSRFITRLSTFNCCRIKAIPCFLVSAYTDLATIFEFFLICCLKDISCNLAGVFFCDFFGVQFLVATVHPDKGLVFMINLTFLLIWVFMELVLL